MKTLIIAIAAVLLVCPAFGQEQETKLQSLGARRAMVRYKAKVANAERLYKAALLRAAKDLKEELQADLIKVTKTGNLESANQVKAELDRIQAEIEKMTNPDAKPSNTPSDSVEITEGDPNVKVGKLKPTRDWWTLAQLKAGDKVYFRAAGTWEIFGVGTCGPDGGRGSKGDKNDPLPGAPVGAILGRLPGSTDEKRATGFVIGRSAVFTAKEDGAFQLRVNKTSGYIYKCDGELAYKVKVVPAN